MNDVFIQGSINPLRIADSLSQLSAITGIGGHGIFLGQVRDDLKNGQMVKAIDYSIYEDMAYKVVHQIKDEIKIKYGLMNITVLHSVGAVPVGELCLFVLAASKQRKAAIDSCQETVERIKAEVPIWGREIYRNDSFSWKSNL